MNEPIDDVDLSKNPVPNDAELDELVANAKSVMVNPALKFALSQARRNVYAEMAGAVPDHLTSVALHAKLRAVEAIPSMLQAILNEQSMRQKMSKRTK